MNRIFFILVGAVAVGALLLMVQASQSGTSQVFTPGELLARTPEESIPRLRIAGKISAQVPISYVTEPSAELRFSIENPSGETNGSVPVVYRDLKPDMFSAGRDVIIDGEFSGGVITASSLLTQCPSKYEPPSAEKQYPLSEKATN